MRWLLGLSAFFLCQAVGAFPELTRFGYNNCTACHVSPSGGGVLTSYGKSLSAEFLSTWGQENDTGLFWRAVDREALEKYFVVGGDLRAVQVHYENARVRDGRFIKMQAQVEPGFVTDHFGGAIAIGELSGEEWRPTAKSYYAFWRPRDEVTLRVGRFMPSYGLRLPDHIAFARSFLGFGLNSERDAVEAQWTGETWTFHLTQARQFDSDAPETATSAQGQVFFKDRFKLAANIWSGTSKDMSRMISGVWGVLGFSKKFYWLVELDEQTRTQQGSSQRSFVSFNRLGYTLFKGFDLLLQSERLHADLDRDTSVTNRHGAGFQFFPVPHLELSGLWSKQKASAPGSLEEDYAWLLMHYYF